MEQESSQTPSGAHDRSTRHVYLGQEETVRLFALLQMLIAPRQFETSICLKNPNQSCDTSSECSLTKILSCSTPPVEVVLRCERQRQLVQSFVSEWRSTRSSLRSLEKLLNEPEI